MLGPAAGTTASVWVSGSRKSEFLPHNLRDQLGWLLTRILKARSSERALTDDQIAQFLDEHPDFSPALLAAAGDQIPAVYGFYGPNAIFLSFADIIKTMAAKPSCRQEAA